MKLPSVLAPTGLLTGLMLAQPAAAAGEGCPAVQDLGIRPQIEVQTVVPAAQYRNDLAREQLTAIMRRQGSNGSGHGTVLGLTYGTYDVKWAIQSYTLPRGPFYCHYLRSADVRLQIPTLTVFIASEYRQGTCQFQVITTHENEHVRVNQYVLRKYAPVIKQALIRQAAKVLPVVSGESNGMQAIERALQPALESLMMEMYNERNRGNAGIDTHYQYRRALDQCPRW